MRLLQANTVSAWHWSVTLKTIDPQSAVANQISGWYLVGDSITVIAE